MTWRNAAERERGLSRCLEGLGLTAGPRRRRAIQDRSVLALFLGLLAAETAADVVMYGSMPRGLL